MKLFKLFFIFFMLISITLLAEIVNYSQLPEELQTKVIPDMDGRVLISDLESQLIENEILSRELPSVVNGWPVSYAGSNCKNGAIYVNMDADADLEILFGVGTKITALNLDGSTVTGWPVQLAFYIWSSPAVGDIDGDGEIEIVCTSRNNSSANTGALYAFELDGTPCTGFPVTQAGGGTNNVCLYDLDSNGDMEILVNIRNHPQGWVYVYDGDGSVVEGWPQELDYIPGAGISAGDITGDGVPEVVALSYNKLHVFDLSGNLLPGFPLENTGYTYSYSQPILCDIDDDGLREIIWGGCSSNAGAVFAVNNDASSAAGWPQTTAQWIFGTVALGDVDQDGSLDVVVGDQVSSGTPIDYIYAWDSGGNTLTGFPAGPTNAIYAQIGIADLDGDNNVELMIDDNNFGFGYNAYNHDGTHCADWPLPCGTVWSSTTMQISPIFGDVDNDGDLEIMGAATDIMNWVVECYLWDTDSAWNEDLAYMIIDGVNIQHNGLYDPDDSSVLYPPRNVQVEDWSCTVSWDPPIPSSNVLTGYNIYLDGMLDATVGIDVFEYMYVALMIGEMYTAGVSAIYDEGESEIIEVDFTYTIGPPPFDPPNNPMAEVDDYNDVLVAWEAPGGAAEWIRWDSGENADAIGLTAGGTFYVASRWEPADLAAYDGLTITKLEYFPNDVGDYVMQVWTGANAGTLVSSEAVTTPTVGAFQEIVLSTPVTIDASQELWFGYEITHAAGAFPAGCDAGPAIAGYGDLISQDGGVTWDPLSGFGLDYNWNLGANLEGSDGMEVTISKPHKEFKPAARGEIVNPFSVIATSALRESRSLAGYRVYQDGVMVGEVADPTALTYLVESLDAGTYEFTITAYYTSPEGESEPTDPVTAEIVLNPPANVDAQSQPPNIIITWEAPARGVDNYNVYRDSVLHAAGVTGTMYIDVNVSGNHYWNITAVYDGGWESEFSETVGAGPWPGTDPNSIPLVTDLNGNYPNPFNPETIISFSTTELVEKTEIIIYNLKGQKIKTLLNEILPAGIHSIIWNGTDNNGKNVSSGVYLYKMQAGNYSETKKMLLLK